MTVFMTTSTTEKPKTDKDFVTRLADAGEEAPHGGKCAAYPSAKKVRGIDELEARVAKLEKELAALKKAKAPTRGQAPDKPAA